MFKILLFPSFTLYFPQICIFQLAAAVSTPTLSIVPIFIFLQSHPTLQIFLCIGLLANNSTLQTFPPPHHSLPSRSTTVTYPLLLIFPIEQRRLV